MKALNFGRRPSALLQAYCWLQPQTSTLTNCSSPNSLVFSLKNHDNKTRTQNTKQQQTVPSEQKFT